MVEPVRVMDTSYVIPVLHVVYLGQRGIGQNYFYLSISTLAVRLGAATLLARRNGGGDGEGYCCH
ncbi:MAG: hypothetical protein ACTSXC_04685 [Candidatus Freyarchaeota archaeon]|nr:hypothetical protein [Candidatus Freyrarchaeum guaymaensis]